MHALQLWLSAAILIHAAIGLLLLRDAWREYRHRRSLAARLAALRHAVLAPEAAGRSGMS